MRRSFSKRITAAFLALVTVLATLPAIGITVVAANTEAAGDEYVSLPITIRDYAADGMLFEYNDEDNSGPQNVGATVVQPALKITTAAGGSYSSATKTGYVQYTSKGTSGYITYYLSSYNKKRTDIRYCVLSYKTDGDFNSGTNNAGKIAHRWSGGDNYVNFGQGGYNSSSFKNVVVDLGSGTQTVQYVSLYPSLASGKHFDIAYIAFFSNKTDADNYAKEAAGNNGKNYTGGNNMQFGFLMGNGATHEYYGSNIVGDTVPDRIRAHMATYFGPNTFIGVNANNTPNGKSITLANGAKETVLAGYTRVGLVQTDLGADKQMIYNKATVDYLAWLLEKTLTVKEKSGSNYNFNYVMGAKVYDDNGTKKDIATVLRGSITGGTGTYAAAQSKYNSGALDDVKKCTTYYEAAYFLLHNIFSDSKGYGQTIGNYNTLRLLKRTAADGHTYYCFNSAYNNADYNYNNGYIANTGFVYDKIYHKGWMGIAIPWHRFDPIGNRGYGINGNQYRTLTGNTEDGSEFYKQTNYNLTLEGHAQFIFYEDDNLYFTFTGDDDVYLFINGKMVMDLGGGHSISKVTINLNDVKTLCGLKDGEAYDFDFYYMERHGTAANFGIETNIRVVDPAMKTEKKAYQSNVEVGNYGFVDPNRAIDYRFSLRNSGEAKIEELTFNDPTLGINLTKDKISLNSETKITDLSATVTAADGTVLKMYATGNLTEAELKALLTDGLEIGETLTIHGFKYKIPDASWKNDQFPNTVYTTASSKGENASHRTLTGIASCTVQKAKYTYPAMHYYEWSGKGVTAAASELIETIKNVIGSDPGSSIALCSPSGKTGASAEINEYAVLAADGITYTGVKTGADTYYYKVGDYGPVAVTVYSYDVADNVYVLDYSLPVELNGADFGLLKNDTLTLDVNPHATTSSALGIVDGSKVENYGTFTYDAPSLKYTMNAFMNGKDSVKVRVQVLEDGASGVTTRTGVVMEETVNVVPANVVYYEDDFPGITYISEGENNWAHYRTNDSDGNEQSADQDSPYGSDPNYRNDKDTSYSIYEVVTENLTRLQRTVIDRLKALFNVGGDSNGNDSSSSDIAGDSSNGTVSQLVVKKTGDVMSFEFRGTGFEIVSRTTADEYAVVSVKVEAKNADGSYTVVKQFPVITECKGGDLYQVPIIAVKGMDAGIYRVTLKAAGGTDTKTRVLYIDGIRIYNPLEGFDDLIYGSYNPSEAGAKFYEIKNLIGDGMALYGDISGADGNTKLITGSTLIENTDGDTVLTATESIDEYLKLGPNNELYLDGTSTYSALMLAFRLIPTGGDVSARTVQIGVHRKANYMWGAGDQVDLVYGGSADDIIDGRNTIAITSGTEQYSEIDISKLTPAADGSYLLLVGTTDMEHSYNALVLTNLKINGYELVSVPAISTENSAELLANPAVVELLALTDYYRDPYDPNLSIKSASLKITKLLFTKTATLTVRADSPATRVVVTDSEGNEVECRQFAVKFPGLPTTIQATWQVRGSRGKKLTYTVRVYNAEGLASVNTQEVSATIR